MEAATAAPWGPAGTVRAPKIETAIERAVRMYAAVHYEAGADPYDFIPDGALTETQAKASLYLDLCKNQTGDTIPDDVLQRRRRDAGQLRDMSHTIARKLEDQGFPAYRREQFSLYHFYIHSNHIEKIPSFRRIIILPYIGAMTRAPLLSAAEFFVEKNPFSRFWTFTSGKRCKVIEVRERVRQLHRKISKLNFQPFMKAAGVEIVLRSTELGTPEDGGEGSGGEITFEPGEISTASNSEGLFPAHQDNGEFTFHPHAHCIVHLKKGPLRKQLWSKLLQNVWEYWGDQWYDGEIISDARECLKYVTKPGEMLKLPGETLAELSRQLRRMKLAQPLGILADEIKGRRDAIPARKLIRMSTPDGPVFREVLDWNRCDPSTKEQRDRAAAERLDAGDPRPATRVVARLLPSIGPSGVKEPRMVIMSNEPLEVALLRQHEAIAPVIACSSSEYFAGLAIRVHTCTSTVLPGLDVGTFSAWKPPPADTIEEYLSGRRPKPGPKTEEANKSEEPREGAIVKIRTDHRPPRWAMLGRSWVTRGGTVRFDIQAGAGFRPGTSVDTRQIIWRGV